MTSVVSASDQRTACVALRAQPADAEAGGVGGC